MEIKNNQITIEIPEGMKIDIENSDLTKGVVKFKKKDITYDDIWSAIIAEDINTKMNIFIRNNQKLDDIGKLINIARYYNGNWKPNWNNIKENKYYIRSCDAVLTVDYTLDANFGSIFFKNKADAQAVIDNPNFKDILDTIYK